MVQELTSDGVSGTGCTMRVELAPSIITSGDVEFREVSGAHDLHIEVSLEEGDPSNDSVRDYTGVVPWQGTPGNFELLMTKWCSRKYISRIGHHTQTSVSEISAGPVGGAKRQKSSIEFTLSRLQKRVNFVEIKEAREE